MLVAIDAALVVTGGVGVVSPYTSVAVGSVIPLKGTMLAANLAGGGISVAV